MPTYEYACAACGHAYELFEGIKSKPNSKCPKCKKLKAQRMISGGAGIIFKGSGFYSTDYRSGKYKESAKKENSKADAPSASSGDPKSAGSPKKVDAPSAGSGESKGTGSSQPPKPTKNESTAAK